LMLFDKYFVEFCDIHTLFFHILLI